MGMMKEAVSSLLNALHTSRREHQPGDAAHQDPTAVAADYIPRLERNLLENIVPFWLDRAVDREHGGYSINHDHEGRALPPGTKGLVTQARLLWLFSRLSRGEYGRPEHLEAAEWGYRFLLDALRDTECGGFHWEVDAGGGRKVRSDKHLYGQAFALLALAEYALASGDAGALDQADRCHELIVGQGHDSRHGGYVESLDRHWRPLPAGEISYLGLDARLKTMNTHMHLLEATAAYLRARPMPMVRQRLMELILILSGTVVRSDANACADEFTRDWSPFQPERTRVSYGHDLENAWLLIDACEAADCSPHPLLPRLGAIFAYSLSHGYDSRRGGFYESGPPRRMADRRDKVWWVQAEAAVCCLRLHRLTGDARYLSVFRGTYDFIELQQVDWVHGEWHGRVTTRGPAVEPKAHPWKTGFHNGRAMLECLELLKSLRR